MLSELDRTLRITDGVLRFRIVKLKPGTPDAPDMPASAGAGRHPETGVSTEVPTAEMPSPAQEPVGEPA